MVNLLRSLLRWTRALAAIYTSSSCNNVRSVIRYFKFILRFDIPPCFLIFVSTYKSAHLIFYFYSTSWDKSYRASPHRQRQRSMGTKRLVSGLGVPSQDLE